MAPRDSEIHDSLAMLPFLGLEIVVETAAVVFICMILVLHIWLFYELGTGWSIISKSSRRQKKKKATDSVIPSGTGVRRAGRVKYVRVKNTEHIESLPQPGGLKIDHPCQR